VLHIEVTFVQINERSISPSLLVLSCSRAELLPRHVCFEVVSVFLKSPKVRFEK